MLGKTEKPEGEFIQLDYVMGRKNCLALKEKSAQIYGFVEAYGKYFEACRIAEIQLDKDLRRLIKGLG
jgi:hypothetical protein